MYTGAHACTPKVHIHCNNYTLEAPYTPVYLHVHQLLSVHACALVYMHVHQKCIYTATYTPIYRFVPELSVS